jgi:demethylmenaquinone methyltransferase/2-methoxy-6-polyprenyl-1,4-benzoquinol methylase
LRAPSFDHFGILAPFYERVINTPDMAYLYQLCDVPPGHRLLDVGGGTGRVTQHFRGMVRHVCVVDVSVGMLREAHAKGGLCAGQAVAEHLPFCDGVFERIIAVDSFHHFRDHPRAAQELARVLAPGGRLVIEEPDIRHFAVKLVALGETLTLMRSHFRRAEVLADYFVQLEFRVSVHTNGSFNYWVVVEK